MRRRFPAAFKAQLVEESLKGEKTVAQIAAKHKIHPVMLTQWRTAALKGLASLFDEKRNVAVVNAEHEAQIQELHEQIGRLTVENSWLKKKSGLDGSRR